MNFTLDYLRSIDACEPARRAFASRFGADGTATAQDVFRALADLQRVDWLEWLCNAAPGFPYAVGNCEAENGWQCVTAGEHLAQVGIFCVASDNATVRATGNATVQAYGNATVQAYGNATVRASDNATVRATGNATVQAYGNATVQAYGNATVQAYGNATVQAYDNATVRASDNATVEASDNATVRASGNATVLTQYFASGVKTILHSDMACWIDRRDGALKVITAATQEQPV